LFCRHWLWHTISRESTIKDLILRHTLYIVLPPIVAQSLLNTITEQFPLMYDQMVDFRYVILHIGHQSTFWHVIRVTKTSSVILNCITQSTDNWQNNSHDSNFPHIFHVYFKKLHGLHRTLKINYLTLWWRP
jgi:hypothetical protein